MAKAIHQPTSTSSTPQTPGEVTKPARRIVLSDAGHGPW